MKHLLVLAGVLSLSLSMLVAQDNENSRRTLSGLRGVMVGIEAVKPEMESRGLGRSTLQTDVELRLRAVGIPVLDADQRVASPGRPLLYVQVATMSAPELPELYAFTVRVALMQEVRLNRDIEIGIMAPTWDSQPVQGLVGSDHLYARVRTLVRDQTDRFANAYLAANPRTPSGR